MVNFIKRLAPVIYTYSVVGTLILTGSFLFISSSEFISGELIAKDHISIMEPRDALVTTDIRDNTEVFRGDYPVLEGGAVTLGDIPIGSSKTVHVPYGEHADEYYEQSIDSSEYSPFVYAYTNAEKDLEERYLITVYSKGREVVVSVGKHQYESLVEGDRVLVRSDGVEVTKGGD